MHTWSFSKKANHHSRNFLTNHINPPLETALLCTSSEYSSQQTCTVSSDCFRLVTEVSLSVQILSTKKIQLNKNNHYSEIRVPSSSIASGLITMPVQWHCLLVHKQHLSVPQESIIIRPYVALDSQISAAIPVSQSSAHCILSLSLPYIMSSPSHHLLPARSLFTYHHVLVSQSRSLDSSRISLSRSLCTSVLPIKSSLTITWVPAIVLFPSLSLSQDDSPNQFSLPFSLPSYHVSPITFSLPSHSLDFILYLLLSTSVLVPSRAPFSESWLEILQTGDQGATHKHTL